MPPGLLLRELVGLRRTKRILVLELRGQELQEHREIAGCLAVVSQARELAKACGTIGVARTSEVMASP